MTAELSPTVGKWYRRENGELFEVVAVDEEDATVEIQYFDGTIEELDFDTWEETEIEEVEPPEDWSGSVDVDEEDLEELEDKPNQEWDDPLEYLDQQE
jgi:hypothetical protein